jgi:hypothetical protein
VLVLSRRLHSFHRNSAPRQSAVVRGATRQPGLRRQDQFILVSLQGAGQFDANIRREQAHFEVMYHPSIEKLVCTGMCGVTER